MKSKRSKKFLLLIDGPMGSGKTTVSKLIHAKLKRTAHIGLDRIKWFISDFERTTDDNNIVRNVVLAMTKEYLRQDISVIIEQSMRKQRISTLEKIAKKYRARFFAYQLEAPKKLLLKRIKQRPKISGRPKVLNARIERNYRIYFRHKHNNLIVLDAGGLSARQIAGRILKDLNG